MRGRPMEVLVMNCSQPRRFWLMLVSGLVISTGLARGHAADRYRVAYSTYLGGEEFDQLREVIAEPDGSVLVGGITSSSDLQTTRGALQL